jgi:benzoyl-CoA reductase subunit C
MSRPEMPHNKGQEAEDILNKFMDIVEDPFKTLKNWKNANKKKMIGCMPMQIPEEIIHAAGILPIVIPESHEPITVASRHIQNFFCGYARSVIDAVLKKKLDFLDGMVFQDTCHTMRPLFDIIHANCPLPYMKRIFMPLALEKPQAKPFLLGELERFKASVETFAGNGIDDRSLQKSIDIYNENRNWMKRLYDLRQQTPEVITAKEMLAVTVASMLMPKEEHSELLKKLIPVLNKRKPPIGDVKNKVRLVLTGSLCEPPSADFLDHVEEMGGIVVEDDLYTGSRYFLSKVPTLPNPIEALVEAYLRMASPCPTRIYSELKLGQYLVNMVKKVNAKGIVIILVKFCEAHDYTYPHMRRHLDPAGIPYLMVKTEHETTSVEQTKTRLQAFLEMVRGR